MNTRPELRRPTTGRALIGMASAAAGLLLACASVRAAEAPATAAPGSYGSIEPDGTVVVPSFDLPPSIYASEQAKAKMPKRPTDPEAMMFQAVRSGKAGAMRARIGEFMAPQINKLVGLYPVTLQPTTIAGVQAVRVTPAGGVPAANRGKIMLNLPGGGFIMGAAPGTGMVESIPLSALAKVEIVSITYRQAPEHTFPAASEDVAAVYRELLKTHKPEDIAIFGCSAGGMLTAESMAWFVKEGLPLPNSIGIFCASADARFGGDSSHYSRPFQAIGPRDGGGVDYFAGASRTDPLVSPIVDPNILRRFPPTLIITSTRAMDLSSAVDTHRELVKAGVECELNVWDGLGHAFFYDSSLPESREAFDVMTNFFRRHLQLAP